MVIQITKELESLLLSYRVFFHEYVYPSYETPLVEAYGGKFESVFIILHPFIRVPGSLAWEKTRTYPPDIEIVRCGRKYRWTEVLAQTGLHSCAQLNQALLTSIGSVTDEFADPTARRTLQRFLEAEPVWMPTEGRFEPLLQPDLIAVFDRASEESLIHVSEFPSPESVERHSLADLKRKSVAFPSGGSLVAPGESLLLTVDWDSFFTLFYGPREFVARAARELNLEGFFATPNTDHSWFNYAMGCATVTLSPEHWQTV